jgi:molecular chaperone DnaJ
VAALGGEIMIDTVDGKVVYDVKAGTQTDTKVRLKGKGVPTLRNKEVRGDHYITLVVQVPDKLSHEAKELLKKYDQESGNSLEAVKNYSKEKDKKDEPKEKKKKGLFK